MSKLEGYRKQDVIVERIKDQFAEDFPDYISDQVPQSEMNSRWNEICEKLAIEFEQDGLVKSAEEARSWKV